MVGFLLEFRYEKEKIIVFWLIWFFRIEEKDIREDF